MPISKYINLDNICPTFLALCNKIRPHIEGRERLAQLNCQRKTKVLQAKLCQETFSRRRDNFSSEEWDEIWECRDQWRWVRVEYKRKYGCVAHRRHVSNYHLILDWDCPPIQTVPCALSCNFSFDCFFSILGASWHIPPFIRVHQGYSHKQVHLQHNMNIALLTSQRQLCWDSLLGWIYQVPKQATLSNQHLQFQIFSRQYVELHLQLLV